MKHTPKGWQVCNHQPVIQPDKQITHITDFVSFAQSQPAYISQYYTNIVCELLVIEIYELMTTTSKIIIATDGGAIDTKAL